MKSIFAILKLVLNDSLPVYFRRIYFSGFDRVPEEGPLIYACNHPNSFMDALVVGQYSARPVHFLARGDVFNTPFKRVVLGQMHMMPIYRLEEGAENLAKNEETFKFSRKVLGDDGIILIFSEGVCVLEKRLRKLRKGTARLAFDAEAAAGFKLGLKVVPVSTNYTYPTAFRGEVMTTFGEPIAMADYVDLYKENPAKAIQAFNQELSARLAKYVVQIDEPEEENLVEALHLVMRSERTEPVFGGLILNDTERVMAEMAVAQKVNSWYHNDRARFDMLDPLANEYLELLAKHGISDSNVKREGAISRHRWTYQVLGWPFYAAGYLGNFLPLWWGNRIARKKIRRMEFFSSVNFGAGLVLYLLYFVLLVILAFITSLFVLLVPLLGILALRYRDRLKDTQSALRYRKLPAAVKERLQELRKTLSQA